MQGPTGLLVAVILLSIVLAAIFLFRSSITAELSGKIFAFVALCVLPSLCLVAGLSAHMQRSEQTRFCISCHAMDNYGKSLYVNDPSYLPAAHFQNHRVPTDMACYACHGDYSLYGPMKDKLQGMKRIYMQYVTAPPNPIRIKGEYNNRQCLRCHAGARSFEEGAMHSAMMDSLKSNEISCVSSGCHDTIHKASEVSHMKMWRPAP